MTRQPVVLLLVLGCLAFVAGCTGGDDDDGSGPPTLALYTFPEPSKSFENAAKDCTKQAKGKYSIELQLLPADADQQREQLVRRLAANDTAIDLMAMDVIWTPEFAEAGWAEPWSGPQAAAVTEGVLAAPIQTATWKGKLYGAPWNSNTQLLWYRKDLVPRPPETWQEMLDIAEKLPKAGRIEVQGGQFESLSVWFNTLLVSAGGSVLKGQTDEVSLADAPTEAAAAIMRDVAVSPTANPSLANQREDQNRLAFETGEAAFQVNYPFVYPSAQEAAKTNPAAKEVFENMGWARYPAVEKGRPSRVSIGGINIGVSSFSEHKAEAFEAATCLRGEANQLRNATAGGLPPTIASLYDDKGLQEKFPFAPLIRESLEDAALRAQSPAYNDISLAIQRQLHPPADIDPPAVPGELREGIESVLDGGLQ